MVRSIYENDDTMKAEEVARYLQQHPEFFEDHIEFLASIQIPHPHGGHAIPLAERQMLTLRDKSRVLESKLRELVQFGEENDTISERVHRITLALLASRTLPGLLDSLYHNLRGDFAVPAVAVRLWVGQSEVERAEFAEISPEVRVFAESLTEPYFSDHPMFDSGSWFEGGGSALRSLSYLPLRAEQAFGVLVLAAEDEQRFAPDKGTLYLTRLGEIVSMALKRYVGD
jgi:uncharacterized protein YigA (DUF484 family)